MGNGPTFGMKMGGSPTRSLCLLYRKRGMEGAAWENITINFSRKPPAGLKKTEIRENPVETRFTAGFSSHLPLCGMCSLAERLLLVDYPVILFTSAACAAARSVFNS